MTRQLLLVGLVLVMLAVVVAVTGCQPQQPFYLRHVDGDLAHYKGVATEIEYPDVDAERLDDVANAQRPFTLTNRDPKDMKMWDLTLEEAMQIALCNSKVMRSIGGQIQGPPDFLLRNPELAPTIYGPALVESDPRFGSNSIGTEAALSAFDAQLGSSLTWDRTKTPQNINNNLIDNGFSADVSEHDVATFQTQLSKFAATGGHFSLTHSVAYDRDRFPYPFAGQGYTPYAYSADWNVKLVAEMRQPLLQGAGVQFNRIANPNATPGNYNGVMIARIHTDIALADFEAAVRNLVSDVEVAYWKLYLSYRELDAVVAGRDSALATWRKTHTLFTISGKGGEAAQEAQARAQYYLFKSNAENSLSQLYAGESKLRYMLGLAATDGRLIRPKNEPTTAKVVFDWCDVLNEGLTRSVELREAKFIVKQRELELIAAKNFLLPKLDFVAQYRWLGLGNDLLPVENGAGSDFHQPGSNAYQSLTNGQFQEWQYGFEANIPLGFRREMAGVRHAQLQLARERAKLQEEELELSHQLAFAIRELDANHVLSETNFNHRIAAQREVEAVTTAYETGTITIDRVLDAQQRLARADSTYYDSLINYNLSITQVHFRKGSLLEYNGVCLAEGPWPGKAYFDARRRARSREASIYLDYGFTQPRVISRGPIEQHAGGAGGVEGGPMDNAPAPTDNSKQPELVPTPDADLLRSGMTPVGTPAGRDVAGAVERPLDGRAYNDRREDRRVTAVGWANLAGNGNDEHRANPATAPVDRTASGRQGLQY